MIEETKCPICDGPMTSRKNGATGQRFWGCNAYPKCKGTRNTDGDVPKPRLEGTPEREASLPSDRARENDRGQWRD